MFNFLKHYGIFKSKQFSDNTKTLIAEMDSEGFSQAALNEMQEDFERICKELTNCETNYNNSAQEYTHSQKQLEARLAVAEDLQTEIDNGDETNKQHLIKLLDMIELQKIELETFKTNFDFWREHLNLVKSKYDEDCKKLKTARMQVKIKLAKLQRASIIQKQTADFKNAKKRLAGFDSKTNSLDKTFDILDKAIAKAEKNTRTDSLIADAYTNIEVEKKDVVLVDDTKNRLAQLRK